MLAALLIVTACAGAPVPAAPPAPPAPAVLQPDEIAKIQELRREGRRDDALALLEHHPATEALDESALALLGLVRRDAGDAKGAEEAVFRFRSYAGSEPRLLTLLGHLYSDLDSHQRNVPLAVTYYQRALAADPDAAEAALGLARSKAFLDPTAAAARAVLAFEDRRDALPRGAFDRIAGETALFVAGNLANLGKRDQDTFELFAVAEKYLPDSFEALRAHAEALTETDDTDGAAKLVREIEDRFPVQMAVAFQLRARAAERAGKTDESIELAQRALTLSANENVPALELVARASFAKGDLDTTRIALDRLENLHRMAVPSRILLARYFVRRAKEAGEKNDAKARGEFLQRAREQCEINRESDRWNEENIDVLADVYERIGGADAQRAVLLRKQLEIARKLNARN